MAVILALEKLYTDVVATLAIRDPEIDVPFGWKEPTKQSGEKKRIVWVPGDDTGRLGDLLPVQQTGRVPRPLGTLGELFTVYIVGYDSTAPNDELAQYKAARLLYDRWFSAVYESSHGRFSLRSQRWETSKKEFRYGACIVVVAFVEAALFKDTANEGVNAAPLDDADVTDTLGSTSENFTVPKAP